MDLKPRYNMSFLWLACFVAAMGGLLFGYDWVVIGGAKAFYEPFFGITDEQPNLRGFTQSSALLGCILGALASGALSDRFGRKRLLIFSSLLFVVSAIWTALSGNLITFNTARVIGGVGIGLASNLSPMYIAEISPAKMRGRFVSINQLTIVIGILAAQITNWMIAEPVPTVDQLRMLLNENSAVQAMADDTTFDIEKERAKALAIIDDSALANVKNTIVDVKFVRLDEKATKAQKETKAEEDDRIMAAYLRPTWNGREGWRWMFGSETVPATLFFLLMFFIPESPRWLVKYGKYDRAGRILSRVGGELYAKAEIDDIKDTIAAEELARVNYGDLLEPKLLGIVALGVFLAVFQQWCGINVFFNYAQEIFKGAGYQVSDLMFTIVITGIVNLACTFIAILAVDRIGRRPLMLIGAAGLAAIYAVLGAGYYLGWTGTHMLILIIAALACYAMTLAPVTWVVISEIFPNRIRGAAMSVAVMALWVACTLLTWAFPIMKESYGAHVVIWLFGAICVFGFAVIFWQLPETKGKSLEDIERELVD